MWIEEGCELLLVGDRLRREAHLPRIWTTSVSVQRILSFRPGTLDIDASVPRWELTYLLRCACHFLDLSGHVSSVQQIFLCISARCRL